MSCPICTETIINTYTTECFHSYCKECFDKWCHTRQKEGADIECPMCRTILIKKQPNVPRISWTSAEDLENFREIDDDVYPLETNFVSFDELCQQYFNENNSDSSSEEDDEEIDENNKDDWEYEDL